MAPGSIVFTDKWGGYNAIEEKLGMTHMSVNHSKNFRDPETGTHTNKIEGTWNGLKLRIPARNRNRITIDDHLLEFVWRSQNINSLWDSLLSCMREYLYL